MDRPAIIARLRENEASLRSRGDEHPDSDADITIEIDPEAPVGIYKYVGIKEYIASLFDGPGRPSSRHVRRHLCLLIPKRHDAGSAISTITSQWPTASLQV